MVAQKYTKLGYYQYTSLVLFCQDFFEGSFDFIMRLKELRKQRGISQLKLAMDLNMNQNSVSRYENGQREAGYETLIAFADYFHVSIDYLLERTNDPKLHFLKEEK